MSAVDAAPRLPDSLQRALPALAPAFLPEAEAFQAEDWIAMTGTIAVALATRPAGMRRQLGLFLAILNLLALATAGRSLARLPAERARHLLQRLERSPLLPVRRGVWGLRTLIYLGYYTRPEAAAAIGYRATAAGWEARR